MLKVLIADDESSIRASLRFSFKAAGYEVVEAVDGLQALELACTERPDLVILDVMMTGLNGFEVLNKLRQDDKAKDIPVIMLTARTQTEDVVEGLSGGADDYMAKPFSPMELLARSQAVLRRSTHSRAADEVIEGDKISLGALIIDIDRHEVTIDGKVTALTNKEYELLLVMARSPGKLLERDALIDAVWGIDQYGESRALDTHIKTLRKKLATSDKTAAALIAVRGIGYKLDL